MVDARVGNEAKDFMRCRTGLGEQFRGRRQSRSAVRAGTVGEHVNARSGFGQPSENLQLVPGMGNYDCSVAVSADVLWSMQKRKWHKVASLPLPSARLGLVLMASKAFVPLSNETALLKFLK